MGDRKRREFHEALLDADTFEDLPGKWQAADLKAEGNRPNLRIVGGERTTGWNAAVERPDGFDRPALEY